MRALEMMQTLAALLLAVLAVLMSGGAEARKEVSNFLVEALNPVPSDPGMDPSCLLEGVSDPIWPLPEPERSGLPR